MSSVREVAELAGVSVGTVSRYLNGQQLKAANQAKIAAAIEQLDYKQNIIAKGLKNNQSFSIGLLMNSISSRFGAEVVSGIEQRVEQQGYSLLLSGFSDQPALIDQKIDYLMAHSIDGLIVFLAGEEWQGMERLAALDIPVVTINNPNQLRNVNSILLDDRASVAQVMQQIIDLGHQNIGMIAANQDDYVARERLAGAKQTMAAYPDRQLHVFEGDYSRTSGYRGAQALLAEGITALFVSNDNMAFGALTYLSENGIRIGQDLLFGHYDYADEHQFGQWPILSIQPPTEAIGLAAAKLLLDRLQNKTQSDGQTILMHHEINGLN